MVSGLLPAQWALDPPPSQLRQQKDYAPPPLRRQRLPNALATGVAHDAIQASAQPRGALCSQESATRSIPSTYKRHLLWDIELLFRWLKQHLKLRTFMGTSENAVKLQIITAMIAYVLLRLAANAAKTKFDILRFTELVGALLFERRRLAAINTPPPVNPSRKRMPSNPNQLAFPYA